MPGEFDHIERHRQLPDHTQEAHVKIMKHLTAAADIMMTDYYCDQTEAWLRLSVVTRRTWEALKNAG